MRKIGCKCSGQGDRIERFSNIAISVETRTCATCGTTVRTVSDHGFVRTTVTPPKIGRRP